IETQQGLLGDRQDIRHKIQKKGAVPQPFVRPGIPEARSGTADGPPVPARARLNGMRGAGRSHADARCERQTPGGHSTKVL
ncbi:MAG: hypothetical protein ACO2ER_14125, partial [Castellaniella sp.]